MGCGQSKIHLYPRKSKSKANGKKAGHADSDAETDEDDGIHIEDTEKYQNREREKNEDAEEQNNKEALETEEEVSVSLLRAKNLSLLQSQEISSSQQNFFRMLDKKIAEGPDYDSASETEIALEEARLNALVQHWESASLTASICSSASRSLQTTPVRQTPLKPLSMTSRGGVLQQMTTVALANPPTAAQQQQILSTDFLPHHSNAMQVGPMQQMKLQNQNQQNLAMHMNTKMLHQMSVVQQLPPISSIQTLAGADQLAVDISGNNNANNITNNSNSSNNIKNTTTANTSNANTLAYLHQQASTATVANQSQQYHHLLNLPAGPPQLLNNGAGKPSVSPKRIIDARLLMNPNPLAAKQMQASTVTAAAALTTTTLQQQQSQYVNPNAMISTALPSASVSSSPVGYANGGRSANQQTPPQMQMAYYGQTTMAQEHLMQTAPPVIPQSQNQGQSYYGEVVHSVQAPMEYRFPPAISVQRLAPQVQRQLRETQELIKDSCPQMYAAGYGSPGPGPPPNAIIRNQARNPNNSRRPTLETQFSQELS